jgi:hypothetical protein
MMKGVKEMKQEEKSKAGRPVEIHDSKIIPLKVSKDMLEKFPKPWAKHIRLAMEQYLAKMSYEQKRQIERENYEREQFRRGKK